MFVCAIQNAKGMGEAFKKAYLEAMDESEREKKWKPDEQTEQWVCNKLGRITLDADESSTREGAVVDRVLSISTQKVKERT